MAQSVAATIPTAPLQRSGERNRQSTTRPTLHNSSGPVPNAVMRPTAPGRPATNNATQIIQSMPSPISFHSGASNPNGSASSASSPAGITQADTIGIAIRFASTP